MADPTVYTAYYENGPVARGDVLEGHDVLAARDPRTTNISVVAFNVVPTLEELLNRRSGARLVQVVPEGTVIKHNRGTAAIYEARAWHVAGDTPLADFIGPQGETAIEALKMVAACLRSNASAEAARYFQVEDRTYGDIGDARDTAVEALRVAGADEWWWLNDALPTTYGYEVIAIAARDLIGTVPGWTAQAHDVLTGPYRAAFGPDAPGAAPFAS